MNSGQIRLQEAILESFLPRFGNSAELLYVCEPQGKVVFADTDRLLGFGLSNRGEDKLSGIVAYSESKNWLYLIEPVLSANPITEPRKRVLEHLVEACTAYPVYISAFQTRDAFQECACEIAWGTEVWIAEAPAHMVHFKADLFIQPYVYLSIQ